MLITNLPEALYNRKNANTGYSHLFIVMFSKYFLVYSTVQVMCGFAAIKIDIGDRRLD